MRFLAIVAALFGSALAFPAADTLFERDEPCCCCDSSISAISCTNTIPADQCVCAEVVCPAGAPTVWPQAPGSTPTSRAEESEDKTPCCCCNIGKKEIACELKETFDCFCAAVICPPEAPTVWVTTPALPEYTGIA